MSNNFSLLALHSYVLVSHAYIFVGENVVEAHENFTPWKLSATRAPISLTLIMFVFHAFQVRGEGWFCSGRPTHVHVVEVYLG